MIITGNNASFIDAALEYFKNKVKEDNKSIMGGECLHVRCDAHVLNLAMTNGLKYLKDVVIKDYNCSGICEIFISYA